MTKRLRSRQGSAEQLARLRRKSTKELCLRLSREAAKVSVAKGHYVKAIYAHAEKGGPAKKEKAAFFSSSIDTSTLATLREALKGKVSEAQGERILETIWARVRKKVCDKWDLCKRFKPSDPNLILALWTFLRRGQPLAESDLYLLVAVLAMRMGPEWMCRCSKR